jgi:chemotaxis protein MotB
VEEEEVCPEGAPEWMVTFGDMMSLLLTFFILLLSFSTMEAVKFRDMAGSIKKAFGIPIPEVVTIVPKARSIIKKDVQIDFNAKKIIKNLKRELDPLKKTRHKGKVDIEVFETYQGIVVQMPSDDLFVPGTDRLARGADLIMDVVADQSRTNPDLENHELVVEVRSPEDAPRAPRFETVWDLTAAQSVAAARYLREGGGVDAMLLKPSAKGPAAPTRPIGPASEVRQRPKSSIVEFHYVSKKLNAQGGG